MEASQKNYTEWEKSGQKGVQALKKKKKKKAYATWFHLHNIPKTDLLWQKKPITVGDRVGQKEGIKKHKETFGGEVMLI